MTKPSWQDFGTHDESAVPELWNGVVGAWAPCLGPTGLRLHDHSRRSNWGTLTNMDPPTDWVVSGGQYALDFDGTNDFVSLGSVPTLTAATVACWCILRQATPSNFNFTGPPFSQDSTNLASHYPWIDGIIYTEILRTGRVTITPSVIVNRAAWHLVTFTNNGDRYKMFQNDIAIHDSASTIIRTDPFVLGVSNRLSQQFWYNGIVAECAIWDRALSENEIQQLYQLGRGGMYQRRRRRAIYLPQAGFQTAWALRRSQIIGGGLR